MDGVITATVPYGWSTVEVSRPGRDAEIHVLPTHEKDHLVMGACWCSPKVEPQTEHRRSLVIHNEKN